MKDKQWDLIDTLQRKFKINFVKEWSQYKTSIGGSLLAYSDEGQLATDGMPLFDFFSEDDIYQGGLHKELFDCITLEGFEHDWFDSRTLVLFIIK